MNLFTLFYDIFTDYTLRTVVLGAAVLGIVSGCLGTFTYLKKESLLGDAVSHAALPGVALAFMVTGSKSSLILLFGAACAGILGSLFMMTVIKRTIIKTDSALALILSVFFGFGLVLLTYINKNMSSASKAGLEKFLFGQAATLMMQDVIIMACLGGISLLFMGLFWKEFKLLVFDRAFAFSLGLPVRVLDIILSIITVLAIVVGLQTVGVVLMSAMIVAPAASARQWTDKLGPMVGISAFIGAAAGILGVLTSAMISNMPTGPAIVLAVTALFFISLFFGGKRGIAWVAYDRFKNRKNIAMDKVLSDLYLLASQHPRLTHSHSIETLKVMGLSHIDIKNTLLTLEQFKLVQKRGDNLWALTEKGLERARAKESEREERL